jgi:CRISPR-associated protein Cas1
MMRKALILNTYSQLTIKDGFLTLKQNDLPEQRLFAHEISKIIFIGRGNIHSEAIRYLTEHSVPILFLNHFGEVEAQILPKERRDIELIEKQIEARNNGKGLEIAMWIVREKIERQKKFLEDLNQIQVAKQLTQLMKRIEEVESAKQLLQIESKAAHLYFNALANLLPSDFNFRGRRGINNNGRYAKDIVNAALNYAYSLLESEVMLAIHRVGLDAYAGFLHYNSKPTRASLCYDIMEFFRVEIERAVINLFATRKLRANNFTTTREGIVRVNENAKGIIIEAVNQAIERGAWNGNNGKMATRIERKIREIGKLIWSN